MRAYIELAADTRGTPHPPTQQLVVPETGRIIARREERRDQEWEG